MTTKQEQIDQLLASLPDDARPPFKLRLGGRTTIIQGHAVMQLTGPLTGLFVPEVSRHEEGEVGDHVPQTTQYPALADADGAQLEKVAWALAYHTWWTEARGIQAALEALTKQVEKWPKRKRR